MVTSTYLPISMAPYLQPNKKYSKILQIFLSSVLTIEFRIRWWRRWWLGNGDHDMVFCCNWFSPSPVSNTSNITSTRFQSHFKFCFQLYLLILKIDFYSDSTRTTYIMPHAVRNTKQRWVRVEYHFVIGFMIAFLTLWKSNSDSFSKSMR